MVRKYDDKSVAIIDDEKRVHMAHMDIHYGYSVNGVAYLHTEILKNTELNNSARLSMTLPFCSACLMSRTAERLS